MSAEGPHKNSKTNECETQAPSAIAIQLGSPVQAIKKTTPTKAGVHELVFRMYVQICS